MGWPADQLWRTIEIAYGWGLRLRVMGDDRTSILRFGVRKHWGRPIVLPDGTPIQPGDRIGEIHFRNEMVSAIHRVARGPVRAVAVMRAQALEDLMHLALALETDPALKEVQAFFAETLLWQTVCRLGFWAVPVRGRARQWIVSSYQRLLVSHYSPAGWERLQRLGATESRVIWISRAQLLRLYGPGNDPRHRRHPARRRQATPHPTDLAA